MNILKRISPVSLIPAIVFLVAVTAGCKDVQNDDDVTSTIAPVPATVAVEKTATSVQATAFVGDDEIVAVPIATPAISVSATAPFVEMIATRVAQRADVDGDCEALIRPITATKVDGAQEFLSLPTGNRCTLKFANGVRFGFGGSFEADRLYGTLYVDEQLHLVRVDFDGAVTRLGVVVGGFYSGRVLYSAETDQIMWADGDSDPENADRFLAQLWIADGMVAIAA